ncbi:hypothetical protein DYB31_011716 [Aphanomyces astaci]|uniref:GTP cyclohydrolase N-terminal domain-containing protein n=1 Tax=Aphanomyces astaci TaxID=112090 RepID=A0A397FFS9_APHAT|nr:hypothetical protein DYB31_011716 [Aphanomyces astaci]
MRISYRCVAEDVKKIEDKDLFDPKSVYVSLTSHAETFGVEPVRVKIVTIDPFGHCVLEAFPEHFEKGYDIRPTIAAHMDMQEIHEAVRVGRLKPDGKILKDTNQLVITKAAIDPVWYLPGIAKRFHTTESNLRQQIFQETNGMYPELVTRNDLKIFLPPIGGEKPT